MQTMTPPADLETLAHLNREYINAVKTSNVRLFAELLADDFLCSMPDGSLINREQYLEQAARPYTLVNLQAHDVNIALVAWPWERLTLACRGRNRGLAASRSRPTWWRTA